ncbi:MAG TPA: efflux RND transporter permease subunit [Nitrospirota bacterium]
MKLNLAGRLTQYFINSQLTVLLMVAVFAFGIFALLTTPREENPQIVVPAANVFVSYPGGSAKEVEELVCRPLERILREIKGVEDVYSISNNGMGVVMVKFHVGEDREKSLLNLYNKVMSNLDYAPPGAVLPPLFKPIEVDDVPIVTISISGGGYDDYQLKRVADNVLLDLQKIPGTSASFITGGRDRQVRVELDPVRLAGYGVSALAVQRALSAGNVNYTGEGLESGGERKSIEMGGFIGSAKDVQELVVAVSGGRLVRLSDVADISDGPEEPQFYTRLASGTGNEHPAVTVAIAKRKGENSVRIADQIISRLDELRKDLPGGITATVTRNDGERANESVNELVDHLFLSILIVVLLLLIALGWRDALIVALAIPLTLFVTLGAGMLTGQTINRITLFALTLSLGLLVDDAIVVVENIHRHYTAGVKDKLQSAIMAVNEIGSPTVLATLTVILAFLPMKFVTGMMGPYMAPIPFNVPVAMLASLMVAFIVTPWAAYRLIKSGEGAGHEKVKSTKIHDIYQKILGPRLADKKKRRGFLAIVIVLFAVAMAFPLVQWVEFRMLPKANKNTFLITIDKPSGTALEETDRVSRAVGEYLRTLPEVKNYETFVGVPSVVDFNGLLRGSSFRKDPRFADIRVNLVDKDDRTLSSEKLVLKIRPDIRKLADAYGANIKIVEDPPGPPVRSTVLAEIYGPDYDKMRELAGEMRKVFAGTKEVVDIDDSVEGIMPEYQVVVDKAKAAENGVTTEQVAATLRMAMDGATVSTLHDPNEKNPVRIFVRFPRELRTGIKDLKEIYVANSQGGQVAVSELVSITSGAKDRPIYHKNMKPVVFVYGEMGARSQLYAVIDMMRYMHKHPLPAGYTLKWDGEMKLTLDVFRDLGTAMAVAVILIYLLLVGRFRSFIMPVIIMGPIPLAMIGIMPGFALTGVYFSATSMIGVIALAGIVVRNSIILIEFIEDKKREGMPIEKALVEAGAIRTRPIVLTALAAILGASVIAADPVWSGLAWALIFGMTASTALTLVVIPVVYYIFMRRGWEKAECLPSS